MKKIITILTLLCSFGLKAGAQQFLSREAYRDKVEAYSQVLKQQRLKTMASTEARKIANTGFLPQPKVPPTSTTWISGTVRKVNTAPTPIRHSQLWHNPSIRVVL